jgi:hypothetical protein
MVRGLARLSLSQHSTRCDREAEGSDSDGSIQVTWKSRSRDSELLTPLELRCCASLMEGLIPSPPLSRGQKEGAVQTVKIEVKETQSIGSGDSFERGMKELKEAKTIQDIRSGAKRVLNCCNVRSASY